MKKTLFFIFVITCMLIAVSCGSATDGGGETEGVGTDAISVPEETLPEPTETEIVSETELLIPEATESVYETDPVVIPDSPLSNEYATLTRESYYSYNSFSMASKVLNFTFYEYDINYRVKLLNGSDYKGTFLLPEGYSDGYVLKADENGDWASVYVVAYKNGEANIFEYKLDLVDRTGLPLSRELLGKEDRERVIKEKNTFSGEIFDAFRAYFVEGETDNLGKFELTLPISFSDYYLKTARVIYFEDGADILAGTQVQATGYAVVYPLEVSTFYPASDGLKYDTQRYRWGRVQNPPYPIDEEYYAGLEDSNKRSNIFTMKLDDNHYVYLNFVYKDWTNTPDTVESDVLNMLKQIEVKIIK